MLGRLWRGSLAPRSVLRQHLKGTRLRAVPPTGGERRARVRRPGGGPESPCPERSPSCREQAPDPSAEAARAVVERRSRGRGRVRACVVRVRRTSRLSLSPGDRRPGSPLVPGPFTRPGQPLRSDGGGGPAVAPTAGARLPDERPSQLPALPARI